MDTNQTARGPAPSRQGSTARGSHGTHHSGSSRHSNRHDAAQNNGHGNNNNNGGGGGGGGGGGNGHSSSHGGGGSGSSKVKPPSKNLFVAGLDPDAGDQDLDRAFHPFGPIVSCKVMVDLHTGLSRRFGFVLFEDEHSAVQAKSALQGKPLPGRELETLAANPAPSSSSPSKANADDPNSPPGKKTDASEAKSGSAAAAEDAAAQSEGGPGQTQKEGQPQQGRGIIVEFSTVHPTHHLQSRERGLYVRNIPRGVPRYLLEQHFGAFGHVEALEVLRDTAKGATSRNVVAKVSYGSADEAERAIKHTHRAVNFFAKFAVGIVNGNCAVATGAAAADGGAGGADAAVASSAETTTTAGDVPKPSHDGRGSPGHCAGCGIANHPAPRTTHNEMLAVAAAAIAAVSPSSRPTSPLDPGSAAAPTINATAADTASTTDPSSEVPQATSTTAPAATPAALPPPALMPATSASALSNLNLCELYRVVRATASDALTHYLPIEHMRAPECFSVCGRCDVAYRAQLSTIPPLLAKFAEPQQQRMERLAHVQSEKKKSDDPQASDATALAAGPHGPVSGSADRQDGASVGRDQSGSLQRVSSRPGLGGAPLSPTNGQSQGQPGHQGQQAPQQGRAKESSSGRDFTMSASAAPFAVPQGFTVTGDASTSSAPQPQHHGYAAPMMPVSVGTPFAAPPSGYQHPSQAPYPHQAQPGGTNSQPVGVAGTGGSLSQTGDSFGAGGGGVGGSLGQSATVPIVTGHGHHVGGQHAYPVPYAAVGASVGTSFGHMSVGSHVGVGASYGSSIPAYSAVPPSGFHAPGSPAGYHPQGGVPAMPTAHGHMVAGGYCSSGSPMGSFVYNNNSGVGGGHQSHGGRGSENTSIVQPLSSGAASTGGSFAAHPTAALQSPKKTDEAAKLASGDEAATKATSVSASAPGFVEAEGSKAAPVATTAENCDAPCHHHAASVGNSAGSVGGSFGAVGASVSAAGTANVFGGVDLGAATSLFDDTTTSAAAAPVDYSPGKASDHSNGGGAHHHSGGGAAAPAKLPFVASAKPTAATTGADMSTTDTTATNPGGADPWAPAPHRLLSPAGVKLATPGTAVTMSVVAAGIDDDLATPSGAKLTQNPPNPNSSSMEQKLNESAGDEAASKAHHVDPTHSVGSASAPHATASNSNATPVSLEGNTSGKGSSRATASSTTERPSMPSGGAPGAAVSAARSSGSRDAAPSVVSSEVPRMADGRVDTKAHLRGDFPDDVVPPSHQAPPPVADQSPRECGHPTACPSDVIPSMHVGDSTTNGNGNVNGNQQQSSHVFLFPSPSAAHGGDASAAVFGSRAASEEPQIPAVGINSGAAAAVASSNNNASATGAHRQAGASVEAPNGATAAAVEVEALSPSGGEKPGAAEPAGPASAAVSATGSTGATATAPVAAPSPLLCPSTTGHSAGSTGGSLGQAMLFPFGAPAHVAANAGFVHPPLQHAAFVGGGQATPAGTATHQHPPHQQDVPAQQAAQQAAQAAAAVPPYVAPMVIPQQSSGVVVGAPDAASAGSGAVPGPETPTPPAGYQYVPVLMAVPVGTTAAAATAAAAHGYHPHAFYGHPPHHAHAPVPGQDGAATVPVHVGMTPACVGPPSTGHSAGSQGKPYACSPTGPAPPSRSFGTPPPPPSWA